jgi:hypothetical protein
MPYAVDNPALAAHMWKLGLHNVYGISRHVHGTTQHDKLYLRDFQPFRLESMNTVLNARLEPSGL